MVTAAMSAGVCSRAISPQLIRPLLLVSDLDDTLIGSTAQADAGTAALKAMWERSTAAGVHCKLVINTGSDFTKRNQSVRKLHDVAAALCNTRPPRTLPLFQEAWRKKQLVLPQPDVLIAGVGTRCYHHSKVTGDWEEDAEWTASIGVGWDASAVRALVDGLIRQYGQDSVEYRPDVEQHEHKVTALYRKTLRDQLLPQVYKSLEEIEVQAIVIEGRAGRGPEWQFMDLLPKQTGKGSAMRYIQQKLGFDDASTVAAGDANNDLLMLQQAPHAIVVGNAVPELKAWAKSRSMAAPVQQRQQQSHDEGSMDAHQNVVYVASQQVAAGVMEGLHALKFIEMPLAN